MFIRAFIVAVALSSPLALPSGGRGAGGEGGPSTLARATTFPHPRPLSLPEIGRERGEGHRAFASSRETTSSSTPKKPTRIVSTNVCADQLALAIADRDRVISVSRMAIEPQISNFAEAARGITINHARAEEIVELKPDLILGDIYTGKGANRLAQTLGVPVHIIGFAASLDDVRQIIRDAAKALGEPERGETLIATMNTRITNTQSPTTTITALVYEPNGITTSTGTLTHDILTTAGLTNIAPKLMHGSYGSVPLEAVVAAAPQLLILDDSYAGTSSRAQSILRHPAFRSLEGKTARYDMPSRLWLCPGPWVAEAVERLAEERARLTRALAQPAKAE